MSSSLIIGCGALARGYITPLLLENSLSPILCLSKERWNQHQTNSLEYKISQINPDWKTTTPHVYLTKAIPCYNSDGSASNAILGYSLETNLAITSVRATNLKSIAPLLAEIINKRATKNLEENLNILLIENISLSCVELPILESEILKYLNPNNHSYFKDYISLVDTLAEVTCVANDKNLNVITDNNLDIYINKNRVKGNLPLISRQIHLENDVEPLRARKLFIQNFIDTAVAYLGAKYSYDKIHEANEDSRVSIIVEGALEEIKKALSLRYSHNHELTLSKLDDYAEKQKLRVKCPLMEDTIKRIAREPQRKLQRNERFIGPTLLAIEMGIPPFNLIECAKAAVEYWIKDILKTKGSKQYTRIDQEDICS